jgi:hypothetical protein
MKFRKTIAATRTGKFAALLYQPAMWSTIPNNKINIIRLSKKHMNGIADSPRFEHGSAGIYTGRQF